MARYWHFLMLPAVRHTTCANIPEADKDLHQEEDHLYGDKPYPEKHYASKQQMMISWHLYGKNA